MTLARPRIRRDRGLWGCWTIGVIGWGYTPSAALKAWRELMVARGLCPACASSLEASE